MTYDERLARQRQRLAEFEKKHGRCLGPIHRWPSEARNDWATLEMMREMDDRSIEHEIYVELKDDDMTHEKAMRQLLFDILTSLKDLSKEIERLADRE